MGDDPTTRSTPPPDRPRHPIEGSAITPRARTAAHPSTTSRTIATGVALGATLGLLASGAPPAASQEHEAAKPAVVRDGDRWYLKDDLAGGAADRGYGYGDDDALHVMGDWDGDGSRTPAVIRPEEDPAFSDREEIPLVWYLRNSNDAGPADIVLRHGVATSRETYDTPVVGDWDGDGIETIGVVRVERDPDRFEWRLRNDNSTGEPDVTFHYGEPGGFGMMAPDAPRDVPVAGDWDGDGVTTAGVVRQDPSTNAAHWLLRNDNSAGESDLRYHYGRAGDRPLVGDWDGDGTETAGSHRDGNRWLLTDTHAGGAAQHDFRYGAGVGDRPIVWR